MLSAPTAGPPVDTRCWPARRRRLHATRAAATTTTATTAATTAATAAALSGIPPTPLVAAAAAAAAAVPSALASAVAARAPPRPVVAPMRGRAGSAAPPPQQRQQHLQQQQESRLAHKKHKAKRRGQQQHQHVHAEQRVAKKQPHPASPTSKIPSSLTSTRVLCSTAAHARSIQCVAWSPSARYVASVARDDARMLVWKITMTADRALTITREQELIGHAADILDIKFSHDRDFLLSASRDSTVRLWHPDTSLCLRVFAHAETITALAFHPRTENVFLSASMDGSLCLWSVADQNCLAVAKSCDLVTCAAFNPSGDQAVVGTYSGMLEVYTISNDDPLHSLISAVSASTATSSLPGGPSCFPAPASIPSSSPSEPTPDPTRTVPSALPVQRVGPSIVGDSLPTCSSLSGESTPTSVIVSAAAAAAESAAATDRLQHYASAISSPCAVAGTGAVRLRPSVSLRARVDARPSRGPDARGPKVHVGQKVSGLSLDARNGQVVAVCDDSHVCVVAGLPVSSDSVAAPASALSAALRRRGPAVSAAATSGTRASISSDGRRVVVGSEDGGVRVLWTAARDLRLVEGGRTGHRAPSRRRERKEAKRVAQASSCSSPGSVLAAVPCSPGGRERRPSVMQPAGLVSARTVGEDISACALAPPEVVRQLGLSTCDSIALVGGENGTIQILCVPSTPGHPASF